MRKALPVTVIILLAIACQKNTDNPNAVNSTDREFMIQTYVATKSEIQSARLALDRSSHPSIHNFGQRIITVYPLLQTDLIAVANKLSFSLADTATVTTRSASGLSQLNGHSFDTAYMHISTRGNTDILSLFQNELNNGNNTYVRHYLTNKYSDQVKSFFLEADSISRAL